MSTPIYLDYNATTPVDPDVLAIMLPHLQGDFGNASSGHAYGRQAHAAVERAREQVAHLIGGQPDEIVFTGGGSESNNLAIKGIVLRRLAERPHVVTTVIEHSAVLNTLAYLRRRFGVEWTAVGVDELGRVDPRTVAEALRPETVLVSVMYANNEVGTIQPIAEIGRMCAAAGVPLHVDAAQAVGKVPIDVRAEGIDLLTIAGHKLYAPQGVGALFVRRGVELDPLVHGAGQEAGRRAGTENLAAIVGLGAACAIASRELPAEGERLSGLRDRLEAGLQAEVDALEMNGDPEGRLPGTLNVSFPRVVGQAVLDATPAVAASTGSACHSGSVEPSSVLLVMGLSRERALGAVRLSVGRMTTGDEVERASAALVRGWKKVVGMHRVALVDGRRG